MGILVERLPRELKSWMTKTLSYAGRLQLVRSILSSIQNYWAHIFPLSKKIIKAVKSCCKKSLWTYKTIDSKKAPISWNYFYNPKVTRGWSLINMALRNKVAIFNLLWAISFKSNK